MILLVYKTNTPHAEGYCQGLGVSAASVAEVLRNTGKDVRAVGMFDGFELEEYLLATSGIEHVVIYAPWIDITFLTGLVARWPGIQFTVNMHSNLAFLQSDAFAVKIIRQGTELSRHATNFTISSNNRITSEFIATAYDAQCPYLPNLYVVRPNERYEYRGIPDTLHVGLFGATRQLKNIMTGVGAGILMAKYFRPVRLFISGGRVEGGEGILRAVHELTEKHQHFQLETVDWMEWHEFTQFVKTMTVQLQPSFSESFNNVVADGAAQYIPAAVGPAIIWAPERWKVQNPDNVEQVAIKATELVTDAMSGFDGYNALQAHVRRGVQLWKEWIDGSTA
jgi:hypothetical protein